MKSILSIKILGTGMILATLTTLLVGITASPVNATPGNTAWAVQNTPSQIDTYTLTYIPGANGSISGTLLQTVNSGDAGTTVTAVPDNHFHFVNWSDGNNSLARTDTNVTANISVTANFAINTYTLTYTAEPDGSIVGTSPQTVNYGDSGTSIIAKPDAGYQFFNWSDGSTDNPRTDTNVTADINAEANFGGLVVTVPVPSIINGMGTVDVSNDVTAGGGFIEPVTLSSADNHAIINISAGTSGTTSDGLPLSSITVTQMSTLPGSPPQGANIISLPYEFGPSGAQFSPSITMTFYYNPFEISNPNDLIVAYYSTSAGTWIQIQGGIVNTALNTISVQVDHFTTFAVIEGAITTKSTTSPTKTASIHSWWLWMIVGVVAIAVILGIILILRRRRTS